jgi:hypothetical protein
MANTIPSPNMILPIPVPGVDPGPDYANNLNASLLKIDLHDHTPGKGIQVPSNGIDINLDLPFNGFNATALRSARFAVQSAVLSLASDIGCAYVSGVDLYYNDINGNNIRITQSGGIAGTPGSISNLTPPASASYVSGTQTFVFQSGVNTPANLDGAALILRNLTASSPGLTLQAPTLSSDYAITLPALPATTSFVTIDASGNMQTSSSIQNSYVKLSTSNGYGSTNTKILRYLNVDANVGGDITYSDSATLGNSFVINADGVYAMSVTQSVQSGIECAVGFTVNESGYGTTIIYNIPAPTRLAHAFVNVTTANSAMCAQWTGFLSAGDIIRVHGNGNATSSAAYDQMSIIKVTL